MFKEVDQPRAEVSPGSLAAAEERVEHRRIFSGIIIATKFNLSKIVYIMI